jgi:hypothetical protein
MCRWVMSHGHARRTHGCCRLLWRYSLPQPVIGFAKWILHVKYLSGRCWHDEIKAFKSAVSAEA